MHGIDIALVEFRLLDIGFVHVGIGTLLEYELHVRQRGIGIDVVVGEVGDALRFRRNRTRDLRKDIAPGKTLNRI